MGGGIEVPGILLNELTARQTVTSFPLHVGGNMNKSDFLSQVKTRLGYQNYLDGSASLVLENSGGGKFDYALKLTNGSQVDFDFEFLAWLSDVFGTRKINVGDRYGSAGCDTCGWGAKHYVTVYILNSPQLLEE